VETAPAAAAAVVAAVRSVADKTLRTARLSGN
jgi:hypothetical protein